MNDTTAEWMADTQLRDEVARRLAAAGPDHLPGTLQWLESEHHRRVMRRRVFSCVAGGWLLVTVAMFAGSAIAYQMTGFIRSFMEIGFGSLPGTGVVFALPLTMLVLALLLLAGGITVWVMQRTPGLHRALEALDWAAGCDAMTRLLAAGCTYPEAYRAAAGTARSRKVRQWWLEAAQRVERGGDAIDTSLSNSRDTALLQAMIGRDDSQPQRRWFIAADHFDALAQRRVGVLIHSVPLLATVMAGLIAWIALASSLGWMWRAVFEITQSYGM